MTNESWSGILAHLLKLCAKHPNGVKETLGRRRTQGFSDLGWKQESWLYKVNFQELRETEKNGHQGKFFPRTFLLNIVY